MADTTFSSGTVVTASWLNDINDHVYNGKSLDNISIINVKEPTYGAVGDGITDDTAAINAAISAVPTYGATVFFPKGTYLISSKITLPLQRKIKFLGEGNGSVNNGYSATIIKKASTLNDTLLEIRTDASEIQDITFQGVSGNGGDGIVIKASRVGLKSVSVFGMGRDGIRIGTDTGGENCNLWYLEKIHTKSNGRDGLRVSEGSGGLADANAGTCLHLDTQSNGGSGVYLGNAQLNTFIGGAAQNNAVYGWHFTVDAKYNVFFGGDPEANTSADVRFDSGSKHNALYWPTNFAANVSKSNASDNLTMIFDQISFDQGIRFPATQVVSSNVNTLDDYVEGTWTPTLNGATTDTPASWAYNYQIGNYTKIGNRVFFDAQVSWSATGGTGQLQMNLPYFTKNDSNRFVKFTPELSGAVAVFTGTVSANSSPGTNKILFAYTNPTTGALTQISSYASGVIRITGHFEVAV